MVSDRAVIGFRLRTLGCHPTKAYEGDAGWDLYVAERTLLEPFIPTDVSCGFDIELPPGFWVRITGRSSTIRKHRVLVNDAVIDAGYRGPMFACMTLIGQKPLVLEPGWRLAQMIPHRIETVDWEPIKQMTVTDRGSRGFGSSGL